MKKGMANGEWRMGVDKKSASVKRGAPKSSITRTSRVADTDRALSAGVRIPIDVFKDHRVVRAVAPIAAMHSNAKDSCFADRDRASKKKKDIFFPSLEEMKGELHHSVCHACEQDLSYGVHEVGLHEIPEALLHCALPASWIRSMESTAPSCPAMRSMARTAVSPELGLAAMRHAYAHAGGWSAIRPEDRYRIAYLIDRRLSSPSRIRFAHAERAEHRTDLIREYWAELLAFALGIAAQNEAEWRRAFRSRAVRRAAGSPLAYPMRETGEEDLRLVEWFFKRVKVDEPWTYATAAREWLDRMDRIRRTDRMKHAVSGFPPGRLRMLFSVLIHADPTDSDPSRALRLLHLNLPLHLVPWLEHAGSFADSLVASDAENGSLFGTASELAAEWESFSAADRHSLESSLRDYLSLF